MTENTKMMMAKYKDIVLFKGLDFMLKRTGKIVRLMLNEEPTDDLVKVSIYALAKKLDKTTLESLYFCAENELAQRIKEI